MLCVFLPLLFCLLAESHCALSASFRLLLFLFLAGAAVVAPLPFPLPAQRASSLSSLRLLLMVLMLLLGRSDRAGLSTSVFEVHTFRSAMEVYVKIFEIWFGKAI